MSEKKEIFNVLLCGKKNFIEDVRKYFIDTEGIHIQFVSSPQFILSRALFTRPKVVVLDASLDNKQLRNAIQQFRESEPTIPVFALSRNQDVRSAIELIKLGLNEYFIFPDENTKINNCFEKIIKDWKINLQKRALDNVKEILYDFSQIVGESDSINELLRRAKKIIESNTKTVLIVGETGTGKELLARAIHYNSPDSSSPFVDIGCSTIPENLLESELFGHEKGSFTDAHDRKIGLFELAGGGTIFLDEIGDISSIVQSKLLKVIESRVIRRIGGTRDIPVRARIIAATSINLEEKVLTGEFRRDLYHRLKILPLELPSLRERKEDIPILVEAFVKQYNELYSKEVKGASKLVLRNLMEKDWHGNIRELKHAVERAVLLCENEILGINDFEFVNEFSVNEHFERKNNYNHNSQEISIIISLKDGSLNKLQKEFAKKVLEAVGGNKSRASTILKISRPRLSRLID